MMKLQELLRLHGGLTSLRIEHWVARGLLRPISLGADDGSGGWQFEQIDVARVRLLAELGDDIGLDDDTVEVMMSLVDQVHTLRDQLDLLAQAISVQPPATREAIAVALRRLGRHDE